MANPGNLTEEQMQVLAKRIAAMVNTPTDAPAAGVRQYVGARYVPVFANPLEWTDTREYEPLTIVTNAGNSYTSTQYVPTGIDITNTQYWALTGNFNAQVEAYRAEVASFEGRITDNEIAIKTVDNKIYPLSMLRGKNMVVFGDSWTSASSTTSKNEQWVKAVADYYGMVKWNFAVGGAGFARPEELISQQLNNVDMSADQKQNTAIVIFYAGLNDVYNNYADLITNAVADYNQAHTMFPNARIIFGFTNKVSGLTPEAYNRYTNLCGELQKQTGAQVLNYSPFWLLGKPRSYSDNNHPNEDGLTQITNYMISAVAGENPMRYAGAIVEPKSGVIGTLNAYLRGDSVHISVTAFQVTESPAAGGTKVLFKLPPEYAPMNTITIPGTFKQNNTFFSITIEQTGNVVLNTLISGTVSPNTTMYGIEVDYIPGGGGVSPQA